MKNSKNSKKILSMVIALAMVLSLVPAAFATAVPALNEGVWNPLAAKDDSGVSTSDAIAYDPATAITAVVPTNDPTTPSGIQLNMLTEKLTVPEDTIAAYAIDDKWKTGVPTDNVIKKLIDKGGVLKLTTAWDSKNKEPQKFVAAKDGAEEIAAATTYLFAKLNPRATVDKYVANYTAISEGEWTLTEKGAAVSKSVGLILAFSADKGRTAIADATEKEVWYELAADKGIEVRPLPSDGKPKADTLIYKVAPTASTGASKAIKVKVASEQKVPSVKADYKKGIIKVKVGQKIFTGEKGDFDSTATALKTAAAFKAAEADQYFAGFDKEAAKAGLNISGLLIAKPAADPAPAEVTIWTAATAAKPASAYLTYKLAYQAAALTAAAVGTVEKGKLKQDSKVESYDKTKEKWGKVKISAKADVIFRLKSTAKATKAQYNEAGYFEVDDSELFATGAEDTFTVTWGKYFEGTKEKTGVLGVYPQEEYATVIAELAKITSSLFTAGIAEADVTNLATAISEVQDLVDAAYTDDDVTITVSAVAADYTEVDGDKDGSLTFTVTAEAKTDPTFELTAQFKVTIKHTAAP
ncbi:hypothetical protein FACS1894217_14700 [Clostridia bacterium]|nr:hypothetical protein FACS1894217_14700 [Clostridia bacterium]